MIETPVLLIIWRRPHTLLKVLRAIRPLSPTQIFVACDGPNPARPEEAEKVFATRRVVEKEIDWPCQIKRLYSDDNLGCKLGPIRAITWFFEHVEEGIILEDDCVPHNDFLPFCSALLEKYRHDKRVWSISGSNHQRGQWRGDGSYYFARIPLTWGWATWRRCWENYDADLVSWPLLCKSNLLDDVFVDPVEKEYWSDKWQYSFENTNVSWWDYQWSLTCVKNNGLSIEPNRNLVNNIGFGVDATHTIGIPVNTSINEGLTNIIHPTFVLCDHDACRFTFDYVFSGISMRKERQFLNRLRSNALNYFTRFLHVIRSNPFARIRRRFF